MKVLLLKPAMDTMNEELNDIMVNTCRMLRNVKVENIMRGSQIAIPLPLIGSKKGCTKNVTPLEAVRSAQGCRPVRHPCMI